MQTSCEHPKMSRRAGNGGRPKVLVSIVTYNSQNLIEQALNSLLACDTDWVETYVAIADNSPGDETWRVVQRLAAELPNVIAIRSSGNIGWSRGNNLAVEHGRQTFGVEPDFVLLLNPDACLVDGSLTAAAKALAENPRAGIVGGSFLYDNGERVPAFQPDWGLADIFFQFAGWRIPRLQALKQRLTGHSTSVEAENTIASGAAMVIRWSVFQEIGGLDERYFMYWDDVDMTRMVRERGHSVLFAPGMEVLHEGGASSDTLADDTVESEIRKQRLMLASLRQYVEKWYGPRLAGLVTRYESRVTWRARLLRSVLRPGGPITRDVAQSMMGYKGEAER